MKCPVWFACGVRYVIAFWSLRCAGAVRSADGMYAAPSRSFPKNERAFVSACEYSAEPVPILNDGELAGMGPATSIE